LLTFLSKCEINSLDIVLQHSYTNVKETHKCQQEVEAISVPQI